MWKKYRKYVLRCTKYKLIRLFSLSNSAWSEWIEIYATQKGPADIGSNSAWSEWIEISIMIWNIYYFICRTPHGVRGLKLDGYDLSKRQVKSHSSWSAWIEICESLAVWPTVPGRTPRGVRGLKSDRSQIIVPVV
ncbi:hypothetical protein SAMN05428987_5020 [Paenibacillus sp. CF095]|nr:hypothetical protein SAMN05428987_5020 [Paenibacillus sp. CF095]